MCTPVVWFVMLKQNHSPLIYFDFFFYAFQNYASNLIYLEGENKKKWCVQGIVLKMHIIEISIHGIMLNILMRIMKTLLSQDIIVIGFTNK